MNLDDIKVGEQYILCPDAAQKTEPVFSASLEMRRFADKFKGKPVVVSKKGYYGGRKDQPYVSFQEPGVAACVWTLDSIMPTNRVRLRFETKITGKGGRVIHHEKKTKI